MVLVSAYDYFLKESLQSLTRIPLENQLKECMGLRVLILDYCGMASLLLPKFQECDVYSVLDTFEDVSEYAQSYDVVYVLMNELQRVKMIKPYLKVVCVGMKVDRIVAVA